MLERSRENRLRRIATRRGLSLRKSRLRIEATHGFGMYGLLGKDGVSLIGTAIDGSPLVADLNEIENFLTPDSEERKSELALAMAP